MLNQFGLAMVGVTYGLQYGLLAVGLVLVWRSSRFVNFAHGQIGVLGSVVLGGLALDVHLPYLVALVLALAFGGAFAALLERTFIQKLFNAPRLVLLIASIGIAQTAFGLGNYRFGNAWWQKSPFLLYLGDRKFPVPFHTTLNIGRTSLHPSQLLTLIVAPVIAVALQLLFTRTELGRTIRAAAANPEAARLAGISVRKTSRLVWVIAGVLSTLTAILQAPDVPDIGGVANLGPTLFIRGLAAALLAGMNDFRLAFLAGIGLGVVETLTLFHVGAGASNLVVFGAVLLGVLLRAPLLARGARAGDDRVSDPISIPPLSARLAQVSFARHLSGYSWAALFLLLLALPSLPGLDGVAHIRTLTQIMATAVVALSLTLLTGWAGQISLGHFALLGVGAYGASEAVRHGWGLPLVLAYSGAITALVALVIALPALRFRGLFLAATTLAFAVVAPAEFFRLGILGEKGTGNGTVKLDQIWIPGLGTLRTAEDLYRLSWVVLALVVLGLAQLRRTGPGRALLAVRDNEGTAAAHGLPPLAVKVVAVLLSGFIAGLGGALWGMGRETWTFESFSPDLSLVLLGIVVVGGLGSLNGPILGAFVVGLPSLISVLDSVAFKAFFSGALLLNVLLYAPGGFSDLLQKLRLRLLRQLERGLPDRPFGAVLGSAPLQVRDVRLAFGGIKALDGVSFDVAPGEIVGLIGGNGAGKSTLMNCISGHATPDAGTILVFGQEVAGLPPEYRPHLGLARTFQDARLYPGLTVQETVLVALDRTDRSDVLSALVAAPWTRGPERSKRVRAAELLVRVGLDGQAHTLVSELSTGMRRLLDVATVMAGTPALVLLDEPTAGIAQREVEQFAPLLRSLRDDLGCAIVIVEHDMPLLLSLCDRVYCLENGQILAQGTPAQVRSDPLVIASYLGTDAAAIDRSGGAVATKARKTRVAKEKS